LFNEVAGLNKELHLVKMRFLIFVYFLNIRY